jgi:predicted PurR-regulated permease PerM
VVGLVDAFVRPYLVGKKAQLPSFLLFFALLGGVEVWGPIGLVLGPLIAAIAPILLDMYRQRFSREEDAA